MGEKIKLIVLLICYFESRHTTSLALNWSVGRCVLYRNKYLNHIYLVLARYTTSCTDDGGSLKGTDITDFGGKKKIETEHTNIYGILQ